MMGKVEPKTAGRPCEADQTETLDADAGKPKGRKKKGVG
jgi:hypothetical protein